MGAVAAALLATAGCAGTVGRSPSVVTVTSTVQIPAGGGSPAGSDAQDARSAASSQQRAMAGGLPSASPADRAPAKSTRHGPPTTIVVGRPTLPDPATPGAATEAGSPVAAPARNPSADATAVTPPATDSKPQPSGSGKPPGTPSIGDLYAAAERDAATAGVAPADPDAAGPGNGPACAANSAYVDEAPTGLRTDVVAGWQDARQAAAAAGVTLCLNDGKRSRAQQQAQFDDYAEQYGEQVAEQLVLPPNKSAHVVGIAIDVQPADGYRWLQKTTGNLGFCRIYDNEPWHVEFNPAYPRTGCPARRPEPPR
jgi:hypothetical protein